MTTIEQKANGILQLLEGMVLSDAIVALSAVWYQLNHDNGTLALASQVLKQMDRADSESTHQPMPVGK